MAFVDINEVANRTDLFKEFKSRTQWDAFDYYFVAIHVQEIAGGIPKNADLYKSFVEAKCKEKEETERSRIVEARISDLPTIVSEEAKKGWTGFLSDERGLYIEGRQIKALFKEAANITRDIVPAKMFKKKTKKGAEAEAASMTEEEFQSLDKVTGITNLKSKIADQMFVLNGLVVEDPQGRFIKTNVHLGKTQSDVIVVEQPIHVITPQGPRSSIKITDRVKDCNISFTIRVLRKSEIVPDTIMAILDYGQALGLGADRSQGLGTFEVKAVTKISRDEAYALILQQ
jgi:hypothetical protein